MWQIRTPIVAHRIYLMAALIVSGSLTVADGRDGDDSLAAAWQFSKGMATDDATVPARVGTLSARLENATITDGNPDCVALNGTDSRITVTDDMTAAPLPRESITVEGWVAIETPREWGGIVGVIQDNGDYERGWLLGYRQSKFSFGLVSARKKRITYLTADSAFATGDWYHVAATYDGKTIRLYVDGALAGESTEQAGPIVYPDKAAFVIGSYCDDNEFYSMEGRIAEVSVHRRALSGEEIARRFAARKAEFPGIVPTLEPGTGWPTYMRDAARTGMTNEHLDLPLHQRWCYRATQPPSPAWPEPAKQNFWKEEFRLPARVIYDRAMHVVSDGVHVYFGSSTDDKVYCLDLGTGQERWAFFTEGPVRLAPTIWEENIYFGSDDGAVYCLRAKDGRLQWKFRPAAHHRRIPGNGRVISAMPVRSGVLVDGDRVRFAAGLFPNQGVFQFVLDARTGSELGRGQLDFSPQGYMQKRGNSLLVARGRAPQVFLARLQRSGKPIHRDAGELAERYRYGFITADGTHFFGGDNEVAAYAASNAEKLWSAPVAGKAYGLAVAGGCLLVSTDQGCVHCFSSLPPSPADPVDSDSLIDQQHYQRVTEGQAEAVATMLDIGGVRVGYCLVLGNRSGWVAEQIARKSQLKVVGIESDQTWVEQARDRIDRAGLYGRVSIHQGTLNEVAYAPNLFNLIVSESQYETGELPLDETAIKRLLRPGGRAVLATHGKRSNEWTVWDGDAIEGAGSWTHMYADPANSACSGEQRLNGPLSLQWFGQPGPRDMVDRHHRTVSPLFCAGRLFVPGNNRVIAVDGYNGAILWNVEVPDSRRVGALRDSGNMVATEDLFYVVAKDQCLTLDSQNGQARATFRVPTAGRDEVRHWGYLARVENRLIGTTTRPGASRSGHSRRTIDETYYDFIPMVTSDSVFAIDRHSGAALWHYRASTGAIVNPSIAITAGMVVFVESGNRETLDRPSGRATLPELLAKTGSALVAVDAATGVELWRRPADLKSIQHQLFVVCADQKIVVVGSRNQARQDGRESVWLDIHCFDAPQGRPLWAASQNQEEPPGGSHGEQDQHPVIVNGTIYVEPYAYGLSDGKRRAGWKLARPGHGCGTVSASASACFFRADNPMMCDLETGELTKVTRVSRPGCWINMIPAGGMLLIPEASSGCVCDFPIQSSMAFAPTDE